MSVKAGQLLWHRVQINLPVFVSEWDTGLTQLNRAFGNSSAGEPVFGDTPFPADPDAGSRIQVIPLAPLSAWAGVLVAEPFFDPTTQTVHVLFGNFGPGGDVAPQPTTINVLFWNPATLIGPGKAMRYLSDGPGSGPGPDPGPGPSLDGRFRLARDQRFATLAGMMKPALEAAPTAAIDVAPSVDVVTPPPVVEVPAAPDPAAKAGKQRSRKSPR